MAWTRLAASVLVLLSWNIEARSLLGTVVVRVDQSKAQLIKDINRLSDDDLKAIYRSVYNRKGVRSVTTEHLFHEQLDQLEREAQEEIERLQEEINQRKQAANNSFEAKYQQLQKELYPALARLRELVPDEKW